jgi:hypothetical protein
VILDEAHIYCPERGSGEAESTEAVISLMSQGRKRGYAGVIATQRLSKLHKDAAAEANNVIIGRTWLDADQVRAGDALGLSKADRLKMRDVGQGEFYAFGPALGQPGVVHFCSDQVRTTQPRERADFRLVLHHENDCDASTESGAEERQPTHTRAPARLSIGGT